MSLFEDGKTSSFTSSAPGHVGEEVFAKVLNPPTATEPHIEIDGEVLSWGTAKEFGGTFAEAARIFEKDAKHLEELRRGAVEFETELQERLEKTLVEEAFGI